MDSCNRNILPTMRVSLENSMMFTFEEDNSKMGLRQGHQKTKLREWTKVFWLTQGVTPQYQRWYNELMIVCNSTMKESSTQAILSETTLHPMWIDTSYWKWTWAHRSLKVVYLDNYGWWRYIRPSNQMDTSLNIPQKFLLRVVAHPTWVNPIT